MQAHERLLIVITGPVGGGKSSTALALAQALRPLGLVVAVIDLDQVYGFVRQPEGSDDETAWNRARAGAAGLTNAFFDNGVAIVVVEGEFFTSEELDALLAPIPSSVTRRIFTLNVSYSQAFRRVQGDPTRGLSKNPVFLRSMLVKFERALPFLAQVSTVIDADALTLEQVVAQVLKAVTDDEQRSRPTSA